MQYHYDIIDTDFGKFFILDSSKGLHYLITKKSMGSITKNFLW